MAFQIAVRGVPNFAHLVYETYSSFSELYDSYQVKIKSAVLGPKAEIYNKQNKRVILYIMPSEHTADTIKKVCAKYDLTMRPSDLDKTLIACASTGTARTGAWQAIDPTQFPEYPARLAEYREKIKQERLEREAQDRKEAEQRERLDEALSDAVSRSGYTAVLRTLENL